MVSAVISRATIIIFGLLFPAYKSFKAVRSKNVKEYVKWMMYWIVFAIFCAIEIFLDVFVSFWCPFYYELKIIFVLYLLTPYTKGASVLYRKFIHPLLVKHETEIDCFLEQAKESSVNTFMRLGSRTVIAAREAVTNAAFRGQAELLDRMARSHSMGDVSVEPRQQRSNVVIEEIIEEQDEADIMYRPRTSTEPVYVDDDEDFVNLSDQDYQPSPMGGAYARTKSKNQVGHTKSRSKQRAQYQPGHSVHTEFGTMTTAQAARITRSSAARSRRPLHDDVYDAKH